MLASWFLHPALLAGLGLISVPIIIHLLHRFRFKRVRWAAMEFLLDSQKRNRRRLLLEHLLLLLLRCAVVALIVLALARPLTGGGMARWLGQGQRTDHLVVLDDSLSMGQATESGPAFDAARRVITRLAEGLAERPGVHTLTLVRTSSPATPDLLAATVEKSVLGRLTKLFEDIVPSHLAVSPKEALARIQEIAEGDSNPRIIHVISDFQAKDWAEGSPAIEAMESLGGADTVLQFVDVAPSPRANLSLTSLDSAGATQVAHVPFTVEARVQNNSAAPQETSLAPFVSGSPLPARAIEPIDPGKDAIASFDVLFSSPGVGEIESRLPDDALVGDNRRYLAVDLPTSIPTLIVDGTVDRRDSLYLALALAPGGQVATGFDPQVRTIEQVKPSDLSSFRTIYLLNVSRIPAPLADALKAFVERGGGLAIFSGDQLDIENYNDTLGVRSSILPVPLTPRRQAKSDGASVGPDIQPEDHPLLRLFHGERHSFLDTVTVRDFLGIDESKLGPRASVVARYRDGSPLIVESSMGEGRVVLFLSTAGDEWNSWPQNPTYVVAMLLLQEYLSARSGRPAEKIVGEPWNIEFDLADYRRDVTVTFPPDASGRAISETRQADIEGALCRLNLTDVTRPGVYRVTRTRADGTTVVEATAYNIDAAEGDLRKVTRTELADRLPGTEFSYFNADDFTGEFAQSRFEFKDALLALLGLVLVGELLMGYRLSFHR